MKTPFRLNVHKCKCTECDLIILIEYGGFKNLEFACPACEQGIKVTKKNMTIVEE